ncbi:MAG: M16 family metallopeptidase [Pseudobdellovibrionaceae bacterium]
MGMKLTKLPSGLSVLSEEIPYVDSVAMGLWCATGTRHEALPLNGIAHMVEHMLFKGTKRRTAEQISIESESVGADLNAYTARERTAYTIHLLKDDVALGVDLLADMVQHSTFPQEEIVREYGVILQEIGMYRDTPDEHIFDIFQEHAYPGQTLGANILGNETSLKRIGQDQLHEYVRSFYTHEQLVFAACGNVNHEELCALLEKSFTDLNHGTPAPAPKARYEGGEIRETRKLEQAHLLLGFEGVSVFDPDYTALRVASMILGGGTSSRLYLDIREKRGLAYSVYSTIQSFSDSGTFAVYAGTGEDSLPELLPALCDQYIGLTQNITEEELVRAKTQIKAGVLMGRESMVKRVGMEARYFLQYGKMLNVQEQLDQIAAVTPADITRVASRLLSGAPTVAAVGPIQKLEPFHKISERFAA